MLPRRTKFPQTNHNHDLKHILHDYNKPGLSDSQVIELAKRAQRIIVTKNIKHFLPLAKEQKIDIIGVTETIPPEVLDISLLAKLNRWPTTGMKGRFISISKPGRKR
jgi:hypothetical protein